MAFHDSVKIHVYICILFLVTSSNEKFSPLAQISMNCSDGEIGGTARISISQMGLHDIIISKSSMNLSEKCDVIKCEKYPRYYCYNLKTSETHMQDFGNTTNNNKTSEVTITFPNVSKNHEGIWYSKVEQINNLTLLTVARCTFSVFAKPKRVTCKCEKRVSTNEINVDCIAEAIYPKSKCIFYQMNKNESTKFGDYEIMSSYRSSTDDSNLFISRCGIKIDATSTDTRTEIIAFIFPNLANGTGAKYGQNYTLPLTTGFSREKQYKRENKEKPVSNTIIISLAVFFTVLILCVASVVLFNTVLKNLRDRLCYKNQETVIAEENIYEAIHENVQELVYQNAPIDDCHHLSFSEK